MNSEHCYTCILNSQCLFSYNAHHFPPLFMQLNEWFASRLPVVSPRQLCASAARCPGMAASTSKPSWALLPFQLGACLRFLHRTATDFNSLSLDSFSVSTWQESVSASWNFSNVRGCVFYLFFFFTLFLFLPLPCFPPFTWQWFLLHLTPTPRAFYAQTRGLGQGGICKWGSTVKEQSAQAWNDFSFRLDLYHMACASWWVSCNSSDSVLWKDNVWHALAGVCHPENSKHTRINGPRIILLVYF